MSYVVFSGSSSLLLREVEWIMSTCKSNQHFEFFFTTIFLEITGFPVSWENLWKYSLTTQCCDDMLVWQCFNKSIYGIQISNRESTQFLRFYGLLTIETACMWKLWKLQTQNPQRAKSAAECLWFCMCFYSTQTVPLLCVYSL